MSDRFYTQMADHFSMAPWELNIALRDSESPQFKSLEKKCMPKVTRKELNTELNSLLGKSITATKLPMPTLQVVVDKCKSGKLVKVPMPSGRLKAPYIEALHTALNVSSKEPLDFSTATVALMKEILEGINESNNSI